MKYLTAKCNFKMYVHYTDLLQETLQSFMITRLRIIFKFIAPAKDNL